MKMLESHLWTRLATVMKINDPNHCFKKKTLIFMLFDKKVQLVV